MSNPSDEDDDELPPLTLQEAERWIGDVEHKAWHAMNDAYGVKFILGNLLIELQARGVLDTQEFMTRLLPGAQGLPSPFERRAAQQLVTEMLAALQGQRPPDSDDERGAPGSKLFH